MPRVRQGERARIQFVFGLVLKGPFRTYHPGDVEVDTSAQSNLRYEKQRSQPARSANHNHSAPTTSSAMRAPNQVTDSSTSQAVDGFMT